MKPIGEAEWKKPDHFKIEMFVIRVGDWGGYLLVTCDDQLLIHQLCTMLPSFEFQVRPVVPVEDAIRAELEIITGASVDPVMLPTLKKRRNLNRCRRQDLGALVFLKTIIPSRKATKHYLGEESEDHED